MMKEVVDYFSTVATTKLAGKIDPVNIYITRYIDFNIPNSFVFHPVTIEEVSTAISKLQNGKSPDYDNITNDILKGLSKTSVHYTL